MRATRRRNKDLPEIIVSYPWGGLGELPNRVALPCNACTGGSTNESIQEPCAQSPGYRPRGSHLCVADMFYRPRFCPGKRSHNEYPHGHVYLWRCTPYTLEHNQERAIDHNAKAALSKETRPRKSEYNFIYRRQAETQDRFPHALKESGRRA